MTPIFTRPTKSEIFTAYNKERAKMRKSGDLKGLCRLNKALGILQSKAYYQGEKAEYFPTLYSCNCKDFEYRNSRRRAYDGVCKNILAERLFDAIMRTPQARTIQPGYRSQIGRYVYVTGA